MSDVVQAHNLKAQSVWNSAGGRYDEISRNIADAIEHAVARLHPQTGERILDLATGTGWGSRLIAQRFPGVKVTGADIADVMLVTLVVSVVFFGASHGLLHDRMGEAALDPHDHGLILLVAYHNALQRSLWHSITPAFPSPRRRPTRAPASARRWS